MRRKRWTKTKARKLEIYLETKRFVRHCKEWGLTVREVNYIDGSVVIGPREAGR